MQIKKKKIKNDFRVTCALENISFFIEEQKKIDNKRGQSLDKLSKKYSYDDFSASKAKFGLG